MTTERSRVDGAQLRSDLEALERILHLSTTCDASPDGPCLECGSSCVAHHAKRVATAAAERDGLLTQLAECYRVTGADPDGNEDWRLAPLAVGEVRRLRAEVDQPSAADAGDAGERRTLQDIQRSLGVDAAMALRVQAALHGSPAPVPPAEAESLGSAWDYALSLLASERARSERTTARVIQRHIVVLERERELFGSLKAAAAASLAIRPAPGEPCREAGPAHGAVCSRWRDHEGDHSGVGAGGVMVIWPRASRSLRDTLKALEEAFPPPAGQHHALTYCRYGSDATGWTDKLGLHLRGPQPDQVTTFFVEDAELQRPIAGLVAEIEGATISDTSPARVNRDTRLDA